MTWSLVLPGLVLETVLSAAAFGAVIWFVDPESAGWLGWLFFFVTLFLVIVSVCATALLLLYAAFFSREGALSRFGDMIRRSVWVALLGIFTLALSLWGWLAWWSVLLGTAFFLLVEMYFLRISHCQEHVNRDIHR